MQRPAVIYQPNGLVRVPALELYFQMFRELAGSLPLGLKFFAQDFVVRYRQSLLGISWAVLMPAVSTAVFCLISRSGIIQIGELGVPYAVYAFYGMTVWQLFASLIVTVGSTVPANKKLLSTVRLPRFANLYTSLFMALTDLGVRVALLVLLMMATGTPARPALILLGILAWLPLVLLGFGLGLFVTIVNCITRDLSNILQSALLFLMLVSPVIYPLKNGGGPLQSLARFNPLNYLLEFPRGVFFHGDLSLSAGYGLAALLSAAVFLAGLRFYTLSLSRAVEIA